MLILYPHTSGFLGIGTVNSGIISVPIESSYGCSLQSSDHTSAKRDDLVVFHEIFTAVVSLEGQKR